MATDEEREEALKWVADLVIKYRKPVHLLKLVIIAAVVLVNTAFLIAKLAYLIYERGWLDAW